MSTELCKMIEICLPLATHPVRLIHFHFEESECLDNSVEPPMTDLMVARNSCRHTKDTFKRQPYLLE